MSCNDLPNLYITELVKTLAQLSAGLIGMSVGVPVYNYYFYTKTKKVNNNNNNDNDNIPKLEQLDESTYADSDSE